MATSTANPGQGTGSNAGAGNNAGNSNSGDNNAGNNTGGSGGSGGNNGAGAGAGAGSNAGAGAGAGAGDEDKPLTAGMLRALLGDFRKEVNRDLNGVKGVLEKRIDKLTTARASSTADGDGDGDGDGAGDGNTTGTASGNTGAGNNSGAANTGANNAGNTGVPATNQPDPARLKAERQLKEALKRIESLEQNNAQKDKIARDAMINSAITTASGAITWATPRIKALVENDARSKTQMDDNNVVTIDGMSPKDWMEAQYESDPGMRPAPINSGGSGNSGGRAAARDWSKFNPSDPRNTEADREGYRQYARELGQRAVQGKK